MENNNSKVFFAFAAVIGIGALILVLTRKKDETQPVTYMPRNWVKSEDIGPEEYIVPSPQEPKMLYQNEERINLVRDSTGHIAELVIHRRVTADG
jgi:hypothetical protein